MVPDQSALITVADEQRERLPKKGRTRDSDAEETHYVPMRTMVEDDSCGLDSNENGRYVELCFDGNGRRSSVRTTTYDTRCDW
eukprot:971628-Pyramimonas_sp.AAC.1